MSPAYNVWDFDCNRVDPAYLELALHGPISMAYYADKMRGTTARRRTLTADGLCNLEIPLPSIDEQIRVVHVLDGVRSLIKGANRQIAELDALVKSRFVEMFESAGDHPKAQIGDLVLSMHIGPFGTAMKSDAFVSESEASCVVYEQKHAIRKSLDLGWRYVDKAKHNELLRFEVGPRTILVSCRGTLGKVYCLPDDAPIGVIHPSLMKIEIDESKLNTCYFTHLLENIFADAEERSKGSGVKMAIKAKELSKMCITLPSLIEQQEFASFVAEVDKSRFVVQQQIEKLQMLYDDRAQIVQQLIAQMQWTQRAVAQP